MKYPIMKYPNFVKEKKLWKEGLNAVAGLDEVGRGPLAGPVVAAAVIINPKHKILNSKQILNPNAQNYKRRVLNLRFNYFLFCPISSTFNN